MIEIEPEPSAHKEQHSDVNSTIDFGLNDGHKEVIDSLFLLGFKPIFRLKIN